jgi:hypothetical protein
MEALFAIAVWPLALLIFAVIFCGIFYKPIAGVIRRTRRAGTKDKGVEFEPERAAEQQETAKLPPPEPSPPVPSPNKDDVPPPVHPVLVPRETQLRAVLEASGLKDDLKQAWLVHALATAQIQHSFEVVYRLIFGSQLELLRLANAGVVTDAQSRAIFDDAKTRFPLLYDKIEYSAWFGYAVRAGLIEGKLSAPFETDFHITPLGREFLIYLVNNGMTGNKYG